VRNVSFSEPHASRGIACIERRTAAALVALSVFADAETGRVARSKVAEQLEAQGRLVTASREYTRLAQLQFDGGVAPYSTVLQAEQQLFPAELNYAFSRGSVFASVVNSYKAMGGGWVIEAEKLTEPAMQQTALPSPSVTP
jgi:multidrug efflux system outer membrane protein